MTTATATRPAAAAASIDLRAAAVADRQPLLARTARALTPGASFELLADVDPAPLLATLAAELPGRVSWSYVASAKDAWRVRISRPGRHGESGACCGSCGGGA